MGFDSNKFSSQKINLYQYRVEINPNVIFAIFCFAERSILKLLKFESQSKVMKLLKDDLLNLWYLKITKLFQLNCIF